MKLFTSSLSRDEENIVIALSSLHEALFKASIEEDYLYNLKFKTINEFENDLLGYYSKSAVKKLHDNLNVTYEAANELLKSFLLINSEKSSIVEDDYVFDSLAYKNYQEKNVLIFMPFSYDNLFLKAVNKLKEYAIKVSFLSFDEVDDVYKNHNLCGYKNDIREIEALADKVSTLLKSGVMPDEVKIEVTDDKYLPLLDEVFDFYSIPLDASPKVSLLSLEEVLSFIRYIKENNLTVNQKTFGDYPQKNKLTENTRQILEKIISSMDTEDPAFFKYVLKNTYLKKKKYSNAVHAGSFLDSYISDEEYYFIIGANQKSFPKVYSQSGLITKETLDYELLKDEKYYNSYRESFIIKKISQIKNVYISYKEKDSEKECSKSLILGKITSLKEEKEDPSLERCSLKRDLLKLCKGLDIYEKYHNVTEEYEKFFLLIENIKKIRNSYSPEVILSNKKAFIDYIEKKLTLSYSAIEDYFECPYKYFLSNILKIKPFDSTYFTYLGSFFHLFISKYIDKDFDYASVSLLYEDYRKDYEERNHFSLSSDQAYYFNRFFNDIPEIHAIIKAQNEKCGFKERLTEQLLKSERKISDIDITLKGYADLILKDEKQNTAIIDYKTGSIPSIKIESGLGMQLYIYFILFEEMTNSKSKFFGVFYQGIKKNKNQSSSSYLKLKGEAIDNQELYDNFDPEMIFISKRCKRLSEEELKQNLELVNQKIEECAKAIINASFEAKPTKEACTYCAFDEICYKKYKIENEEEGENEDEDD